MNDGIDYVPTNSAVLLGHHFASIAEPGIMDIQAAIFVGCLYFMGCSIFVGGVHVLPLYASVRHKENPEK